MFRDKGTNSASFVVPADIANFHDPVVLSCLSAVNVEDSKSHHTLGILEFHKQH